MSRLAAILLTAICTVACGAPDAPASRQQRPAAEAADTPDLDAADTPRSAQPDTATNEARAWSREGLEAQPRMAAYERRIAPDLGYTPATTAWRPARLELPARLAGPDAAAESPGSLLDALIREAGWMRGLGEDVWELTKRLWLDGDERAIGVVMQWGLKDDAVAGQDFRIHMRRSPEGWVIERIEERSHCSRGVSDDELCL